MSVVIRPARPDEAQAIAAVHVQADLETYLPIFKGDYVARDPLASWARWQAALDGGEDLLAAEAGRAIVGFGHVGGDWMSALYLLSPWRGLGVGRRLLQAL